MGGVYAPAYADGSPVPLQPVIVFLEDLHWAGVSTVWSCWPISGRGSPIPQRGSAGRRHSLLGDGGEALARHRRSVAVSQYGVLQGIT